MWGAVTQKALRTGYDFRKCLQKELPDWGTGGGRESEKEKEGETETEGRVDQAHPQEALFRTELIQNSHFLVQRVYAARTCSG